MTITMFDCGFGDSFLIEEHVDRPLLVDFGSLSKGKVNDKYEHVINEIGNIENKDFLLTHFHSDHFWGMIHWKSNLKKYPLANHIFEKVYIPAINNVSVIKVLLLGHLGKRNSLLDFLTVFCRLKWRGLECVGAGDKIGGLTVLWPDADSNCRGSIINCANRLLEQVSHDDILFIFDHYSERLSGYLTEMRNSDFSKQNEVLGLVRDIKRTINSLKESPERLNWLDEVFVEDLDGNKIYLNQFGNLCNIVFHNTEGNRNVLFTGDVTKEHMRIISLRKDNSLKLHSEYDVIKIPHHGTERHYFCFDDFCRKNGSTISLIPNGKVGKRDLKWKTSQRYRTIMSKVCTTSENDIVHNWGRPQDFYVTPNVPRII